MSVGDPPEIRMVWHSLPPRGRRSRPVTRCIPLRCERLESRAQPAVLSIRGAVDTALTSLAPDAPGASATALPVEARTIPTKEALLRFDNLFGSGPGQIPVGSTITRASLTLWAVNGGNTPPAIEL